MKTITDSLKRSITADWKKCFASLDVYKPMWLGRLVGPFFQGICLEISSGKTSYLPVTHIHCLCREFPVVSLTLSQRLLSVRTRSEQGILTQFHEANCFEAAERLEKASLLPLASSWGLRDLIKAVDGYQSLGAADSTYPIFPFEDVILAATWLGENYQVEAALAKYQEIVSAWPAYVMARYGGWRGWVSGLRRQIEDPIGLRKKVADQTEKLKVVKLPKIEMTL